jgi:hypothetical protein
MERHRLSDGGDQLDAVGGFQLVDVDDPEVLHDPQVNGLLDLVAQRRQVRARDAPEIVAGGDPVGQPQDLAGESIAPRRLVLGRVARLDEGPQEARHGGPVETHPLSDRRGAELVLLRTRQRLQDAEPTTQGARPCRFTQ